MSRTPLAALAAAAVLVLTTSCGGGDGESTDPNADQSSGTSADASAFTEQSADEIVASAQEAMQSLESLRVSGEIASSGQEISLDLQVASGGNCDGSISLAGGSADLLSVDGATWFKPDEAFWKASAGPQADLIIATVGDNWVLLPPGEASFGQFCDLDQFLAEVFTDGADAGTYTKGEVGEVDGEATITITKEDDQAGPSEGSILVEGEHYLVQLEQTGGQSGTISFSDFNEEFTAEAPAEDQVIDLSSLGG